MTTTIRALTALTLLAGFYLLVGLVVAATVGVDVLALQHPVAGGLKLAGLATVAAFALLRALLVMGKDRAEHGEHGVAVRPEDEPVLWREVADLARWVGTAPPDEIRLVPDVNAAVSEDTRLLGLRAVRRRMYIGLPLLATLTVSEMRSVLGHELGHYSRAHTRLGAPAYRGRVALVKAIDGLGGHPLLRRVFIGYAKLYFRVSQAVSRRQEHEADELAVRISGRRATGSALHKVHAAGAAWQYYLDSYVALGGPAKATPRDLFGGFRALLAAQARRFADEAAGQQRSPYDSHPSLPERLAAIAALPEPAVAPDERPAMVLLRNPAAAEHLAQQAMWTPEARQLPSLPWEELVARGIYVSANAEAVTDLLVGAQRITQWREPTLGGALAVLAHGDVERLGVELRALGWWTRAEQPAAAGETGTAGTAGAAGTAGDGGAQTRALVANVLTAALQGVLVESGRARWALSWSGPARLVGEGGQDVDVDELAELAGRVVADPGAVAAVRAWLAGHGVPESHRPARLPQPVTPPATGYPAAGQR
ncbi:MAG TPA: M48 family metallopeptidase [Streptosporangiaceae bacterium]